MMSRNTISKVRILSLILALAMIFLTPMTMAANPQDPPPAPLEAVSDALEPEHAAGEPEALPAEELSEESTFWGRKKRVPNLRSRLRFPASLKRRGKRLTLPRGSKRKQHGKPWRNSPVFGRKKQPKLLRLPPWA